MKNIILLMVLTLLTSISSYASDEVLKVEGEIVNETNKDVDVYLIIYREAMHDARICQDVSYPDAQRTVYQERKTEFVQISRGSKISDSVDISPTGFCSFAVTNISFVVATAAQAEKFRDSDLSGSFGSLSYDLALPTSDGATGLPAGALTSVQCFVEQETNSLSCGGNDEGLLVPSSLELDIDVLVHTY